MTREPCPLCIDTGLLDRHMVSAAKVPCLCQNRTCWLACADGPLRILPDSSRWFSFMALDDLVIDGLELSVREAKTDMVLTEFAGALAIAEFIACGNHVFPNPCQVIPRHQVVTFSGVYLPACKMVQFAISHLNEIEDDLIVSVRLHATLMDAQPRELEHAKELAP
jgi:hypothetical protein